MIVVLSRCCQLVNPVLAGLASTSRDVSCSSQNRSISRLNGRYWRAIVADNVSQGDDGLRKVDVEYEDENCPRKCTNSVVVPNDNYHSTLKYPCAAVPVIHVPASCGCDTLQPTSMPSRPGGREDERIRITPSRARAARLIISIAQELMFQNITESNV